jgi:hypothetical protein
MREIRYFSTSRISYPKVSGLTNVNVAELMKRMEYPVNASWTMSEDQKRMIIGMKVTD